MPKDKLRDAMLDAGEQGIGLIIDRLRDGKFTPDEVEEAVVEVVTAAVDALIPTGPLENVDDDFIREGVSGVYRSVSDALEREPTRMRARAAKVRARGNDARAKRIEDRAAALEARRSATS